MKYVSIDIETSGKNHEKHDVLSISAIIEDTNNILPYEELPKFNAIILHNEIAGEPFALNMNMEIINLISQYKESSDEQKKNIKEKSGFSFYTKEDVILEFYYFLFKNGIKNIDILDLNGHTIIKNGFIYPSISSIKKPILINVAGKNFGTFDKLFLEKLPRWQQLIKIRQRILDPTIYYVDWENDEFLPNLSECKERANFNDTITHHVSLIDAFDIIKLLRLKYEK